MDPKGSTSVKTRYSFYEAADTGENLVDASANSAKKLNSVAESRTMETEETGSINGNDKIGDNDQRETKSGGDCSERTEEMKDSRHGSSEMDPNGNVEPSGIEVNPPTHEHGFNSMGLNSSDANNAHEKAIREALLYIRKRGQERSLILDNTATTLDAARWKTNVEPVSSLVGSLSPVVDGSSLGTATKLDDRLLSPPADVRKAASDMFRQPHKSEEGEDYRDIIKPFEGLELAKPVNSILTSYGRGSSSSLLAADQPAEGGSELNPVYPHFSIIPSSPAPGKANSLQNNGLNSTPIDTETPEARRQKLELERRMRRELEIEKGVEQVLQSILQRADNGNDANPGESIENILSELFAKQSISPITCGIGRTRLTRFNSKDEDTQNISAVDEFGKEISDGEGVDLVPIAHSKDSSQNDTSIRPINSKEGMLEVEAVKSDDVYYDETDDGSQGEMVLGPLSSEMGGTTGVVLQHDEHDSLNETDDTDAHSAREDADNFEDDQPLPSSPSLISSVTSAARRTSKLVAEKLSFSPNKSVEDKESLVRELYAHILTRHPSQKYSRNSNKPDISFSRWMSDNFSSLTNTRDNLLWDEEDPDEPGYIVHTLSRGKLQEIEDAYENMLEKVGSEYEVAMKEKKIKSHKRLGSDIERDLLDAEKMLDKQKKKTILKPKSEEQDSAKSSSRNESSALLTNPNFPGAKAAGSGEVGDLEIYHLPIIYKAHQTGFEPTKDLVLQPDTVYAGQYYVQSELGSAAFSTAYRCVDLNSGKKSEDGEVYYDEVCLKVIKNTKDFFDQSLDEIKILELLRQTGECNEHNILEMKAFFYHKEHLIIVTELLRQNLFEFGKYIMEHDEPKYFTRSRLCYIARQCLVALSFVHKLGLVHSDIKPENILLASYSRARVKVIDFGSSCYLTDRQSSYIQSRSYRAPEVVLGLPYDGKIDIWSLGCVIAEMYSGQVTFQNDSVVSMLARIEAICGAFPQHMIEEGRQNGQFFTPTGLLYEKVETDDESAIRMDTSSSFHDDDEEGGEQTLFNVLQPKTTTMAERLGFDANLMNSKRTTWKEDEKALFTDFVTRLLTVDPEKRPTADEALEHPWILSGYNLTEEDLKYPPEE